MTKPLSAEASDRLLKDWLNWQGDFFALAAEHRLTLDQLIAWFRSDATQHRISELAALADARAALLARTHRAAAITRLTEIVEDTRAASPQDRIRAATQLLRTTRDLVPQRSGSSVPQTSESRATSPVPRTSDSSASQRSETTAAIKPRSTQPINPYPIAEPEPPAQHPVHQPLRRAPSRHSTRKSSPHPPGLNGKAA